MVRDIKVVATNKKARYDFFIEDIYEAGIVLKGNEVKSLRESKVSIKDSFARVEGKEVYLYNMYISPYSHSPATDQDPLRTRKLLLRKLEIRRLIGKVKERGYTLAPLKVYFSGKHAKIELGLGKGKKTYDKRREIAEKTAQRETERALREREKTGH